MFLTEIYLSILFMACVNVLTVTNRYKEIRADGIGRSFSEPSLGQRTWVSRSTEGVRVALFVYRLTSLGREEGNSLLP